MNIKLSKCRCSALEVQAIKFICVFTSRKKEHFPLHLRVRTTYKMCS